MALVKPQLRGLHATHMRKHLIGTFVFGFSCTLAYRYFYAIPLKQKYADFYKTYDAEKAFRVMRDAGLLQSCGPE